MAGFHRCVFFIICGGIGYRGHGRTHHPVGIHVIAGLKSDSRRARNGAGHVKRGHGLLRVSRHCKVFGKNAVCLISCTCLVLISIVIPRSGSRGNKGLRRPADLIGGTGEACRNPCLLPDSYRRCAAEFRHVGVIRRVYVHTASFIRRLFI